MGTCRWTGYVFFGLAVLNGKYDLTCLCPEQGQNLSQIVYSIMSQETLTQTASIDNWVLHASSMISLIERLIEGFKFLQSQPVCILSVVLNRILKWKLLFSTQGRAFRVVLSLTGSGFQTLGGTPIPKRGSSTHPLPLPPRVLHTLCCIL